MSAIRRRLGQLRPASAALAGAVIGIAAVLLADAVLFGAERIGRAALPQQIAAQPLPPQKLVWLDAAGQRRTATLDGATYRRFVEAQRAELAARRDELRGMAAAQLHAETEAIFTGIRARVPSYADWYYRYLTKYVLMGHAMAAALAHFASDMSGGPHQSGDMVEFIQTYLERYLEMQYSGRVLMPADTEARLEAAYDQALSFLHRRWMEVRDERQRRLADFLAQRTGGGTFDRSADQTVPAQPLVSDGGMHEEALVVETFRRGLLKLSVKRARKASETAGMEAIDDGEDAGRDEISHVIVNLFSTVVDPIASRIGDLIIGTTAGGLAGAMAGGSSTIMIGMTGAAANAVAVAPVGALLGAAVTLSTDYAASRFEERLTRGSFEESMDKVVKSTQTAIEQSLAALFDEHIDGWVEDVAAQTSIERLAVPR